MDVRGKLVELANDVLQYLPWGEVQKDTAERIADRMIDHGATVQEWIPVTERLPKHNQRVLVYGTEKIQMVAVYDAISKGRHWLICGTWYVEMTQEVTHWIPLPEPPCGE